MIMSIIDIRTNESPREPEVLDGLIRSEGRLHRRNPGRRGPVGRPTVVAYALRDVAVAQTTQNMQMTPRTRTSKRFSNARRKPNGLLAWGSHIYYDAYTDAPGGDQDGAGPHETLVLCPAWDQMTRVAPDAVNGAN